mmetsp:Transcript_12696/g.32417  ORF Transcript_12696/g.32417 Transcript_12696/m.32417 type:complete len:463 (-) Transcript_12696:554-1942(-)|eukprot:CAMPEP_0115855798 /NCGR_PEP_ID=MMETSP0287-20121206/14726_1 /TAXON_ID=412157 /ORGANISM="Chrysochromulina rotalis, Strain UIO044" /LENGTH=462 /DNA_ID=CAMNT_0003309959 /DNA_START=17 /DNA_END=1405 /DNA_ORIENTATION=-
MDEQLSLLQQALSRGVPAGSAPIDVSVSRQYGDSTVTMRTQLGATPAGMPAAMPTAPPAAPNVVPLSAATLPADKPPGGIARAYTRNSFYETEAEVPSLLAEIDRLKRKALARGVNLTSPHEGVPAEDVAVLRQVFSIADDSGDGRIDREQLGQLHAVLGEPLTEAELTSAFKAMDVSRQGSIEFEDFLAWYTLAHSASGMLSKKGNAYTNRFQKLMNKLSSAFDTKHLTTATTGEPNSLDFRVQFHYNDNGQLKQISPWHDIPLYSPDGYVHMITEIPKFSRAKFEIATGEPFNPIKQDVKNGKLREYKYGDMCFNYGAFPQTWEDPSHTTPDTGYVGDNDPIDAMEIGYKMQRSGSVSKVKILGCLAMIDDGETDWKVICINVDDPLASQLNDIGDVERVLPGYIGVMREWLRNYKVVDGKPQNQFGMEERALNRDYTMQVIEETHAFWQKLTASGAKTV